MDIYLTQFGADNSTGIGALGLNGSALVIQLLTFVIAFFVLRKYAFKPILKVLNERRRTIEDGITLGERMQREKADAEKKVAEELRTARIQADGIVAEAQSNAKSAVRQAEDTARDKAAGIIKDAEERAEQEVSRARKQLEAELVGLVAEATEALIDEKVDADKDKAIITKALNEQRA